MVDNPSTPPVNVDNLLSFQAEQKSIYSNLPQNQHQDNQKSPLIIEAPKGVEGRTSYSPSHAEYDSEGADGTFSHTSKKEGITPSLR